jgi:hypothetical protein
MPSADLIPQNKFADYIADGLAEYLKLNPSKIEGDKVYKFAMKVWFEVVDDKVKQFSITDVDFKALNKGLNKKYRQKDECLNKN